MLRRNRDVTALLCIIACVALMIAWVRSYYVADRLHGRFSGRQSFVVASKQGRVTLVSHRWAGAPQAWRWEVLSFPASLKRSFPIAERSFPLGSIRMYESFLGFGVIQRPLMLGPPFSKRELVGQVDVEYVDGLNVVKLNGRNGRGLTQLNGVGVIVPFWSLVFFAGVLAAGLLMQRAWRYSLRGLLLTFAFLGVLLGVITILDRPPIPKDEIPSTADDAVEIIRAIDVAPNE